MGASDNRSGSRGADVRMIPHRTADVEVSLALTFAARSSVIWRTVRTVGTANPAPDLHPVLQLGLCLCPLSLRTVRQVVLKDGPDVN